MILWNWWLVIFNNLYISISIFQNNSDQLLRITQRLNPATGLYERNTDNSGELKTIGTEIIIKYQPVNNLDIEFSTTWQETDDQKNSHIAVGESPEWLAKAKIAYQQHNMTYSLFTHYLGSMKSDYIFVDSVTPGAHVRLGEEVDSSMSVGANIRYTHPTSGFYANFHIENILDEDIYTPANESVTMDKGLLAQERQVMLTLGLKF